MIFRLFGYIPSPIIFGNVIDSACLLWKVKRCSSLLPAVSGRCLLYDIEDFRYKYVGVLSGLKLCALALFLYDFFMLRRIEEREEKDGSSSTGDSASRRGIGGGGGKGSRGLGDPQKPNSGSIISLDKCKLTMNENCKPPSSPPSSSINRKISTGGGGAGIANNGNLSSIGTTNGNSNISGKASSRSRHNSSKSKSPERQPMLQDDHQLDNDSCA